MAKIGVIDVGGGLRGIYAAGVFDWCLENGVKFDYGIGISAGSANLASYLSGQRGRNYLAASAGGTTCFMRNTRCAGSTWARAICCAAGRF